MCAGFHTHFQVFIYKNKNLDLEYIQKYNLFESNNFTVSDIQKKYNEFNIRFFDNKLISCDIKIKRLKNIGGQVTAVGFRNDKYSYKIKEFIISDFYSRTLYELEPIILHEMIHVYLITNGNPREQHGYKFKTIAKKIGNEFGREIPITDTLSYELNKDIKLKKFVCVANMKEKPSITLFSLKNKDEVVKKYNQIYEYQSKFIKDLKFIIFIAEDPLLMSYPIKRITTKKNFGYLIDSMKLEEIISKSEIISEIPN